MNKVTLLGNLTRDPEVRFTKSKKPVVNASIAVTERWKTEAGEAKESVLFMDLVLWGATGEMFAKYHAKGSKALVEGKLIAEEWEKDGKRNRAVKVQVAAWHFVGAKTEARPATPKPAAIPEAPATEAAEDDVPF
jgi:single-strand DNA-binding protein